MPSRALTASTTTRALRATLRETLAEAAAGKEIVVTLRGQPYVRIVPIVSGPEASTLYPLRGSVRFPEGDADAPADEAWSALEKKAAKPRKRKKEAR